MAKSPFNRFTEVIATLDSRKDSHLNDYFVKTGTYKVVLDHSRGVEMVGTK
jgi:hypothetical protein